MRGFYSTLQFLLCRLHLKPARGVCYVVLEASQPPSLSADASASRRSLTAEIIQRKQHRYNTTITRVTRQSTRYCNNRSALYRHNSGLALRNRFCISPSKIRRYTQLMLVFKKSVTLPIKRYRHETAMSSMNLFNSRMFFDTIRRLPIFSIHNG